MSHTFKINSSCIIRNFRSPNLRKI